MTIFKKKNNKIRNILLAILPALIVAGLVWSANTYYDLDLQQVVVEHTQKIKGHILPATTTTYDLGSLTSKWANLYAATTTIGNTIIIGSNTFEGSATTTLFTTGNANQLVLAASGYIGLGTSTQIGRAHV